MPFVELKSEEPDKDWHQEEKWLKQVIRDTPNIKYKNSFIEFVEGVTYDQQWLFGQWEFGRARRNTRHLMKGDMCLVMLNNGTNRLPIWCATTKGKNLTGYYCETDRLGQLLDIELLGVPRELVGQQLSHPDAQAYMLNLRAGKVRSQVCASSLTLLIRKFLANLLGH